MTRVTLGGLDLTVEAARLKSGTWNGFARPLFDRANAVAVADYFESMAGGPNGEDGERMFAIRDYFLVVDPNNPEHSHVVRPDDDGLYDFGDGYQWEVVSGDHEFTQARFTGAWSCWKCGLMPLDEDDREIPCPPR